MHYNKASFSKIRIAYNDLYRKILHVSRRSSASSMFVNNNIPTFECLIRRDIFSFTSGLKVSTNLLINTIENCWLPKHVIWNPRTYTDYFYTFRKSRLVSYLQDTFCLNIYHFYYYFIVYSIYLCIFLIYEHFLLKINIYLSIYQSIYLSILKKQETNINVG